MPFTQFYIDQTTGRDIICTKEHYVISKGNATLHNISIAVYWLNKEPFIADKDRVTFFGIEGQTRLAFESEYVTDLLSVVTAGITWYIKEKGYLKMELGINDPRPKPRLRIVK